MGLQGKLTARMPAPVTAPAPPPPQLFSFLDTFCKPVVPPGLLATDWLTLEAHRIDGVPSVLSSVCRMLSTVRPGPT